MAIAHMNGYQVPQTRAPVPPVLRLGHAAKGHKPRTLELMSGVGA